VCYAVYVEVSSDVHADNKHTHSALNTSFIPKCKTTYQTECCPLDEVRHLLSAYLPV